MTNLTVSIDDELLKRARIHALESGASLNAVVRDFLERYAGNADKYAQVTQRLLNKSRRLKASSGGRTWQRDKLHER